ncbi:POZ domain-containing protein [Ceraceosorus guamensis]|uniref:Elongin-C n=1 Tax=Ceraceosorus guamensis TaxID=1522189 RepID=A0A316WGV1_9BASI|nr:POZ domain-containing protein [Ceraceosorus guamensis]PWN46335.1 POZ domain-containing protein [Ceraceosorus guamensis]
MPATDDEGSPPPQVDPQKSQERGRPEFVTLVSSEDDKFKVRWEAAQASETIRAAMEEEGFAESRNAEMRFGEISSPILAKVVEYLNWRDKYKDAKGEQEVPAFHKSIDPEFSLELLIAADFLAI